MKGRSLIVVHSFGVRIISICRILFEVMLDGEEERKEERKKEEEQNRNFRVQFS